MGIGFVLVVFKMVSWIVEFWNLFLVVVVMFWFYIDGDVDVIDFFLKIMCDIYIYKIIVFELLWWKSWRCLCCGFCVRFWWCYKVIVVFFVRGFVKLCLWMFWVWWKWNFWLECWIGFVGSFLNRGCMNCVFYIVVNNVVKYCVWV